MNDRSIRGLVSLVAILLLLSGTILFVVFERQGMSKNKINNYINWCSYIFT